MVGNLKSARHVFSRRPFCVIVGVCLVVASVMVWSAQHQNDLSLLLSQTESSSRSHASEAESRYHNIDSVLQRMAERMAQGEAVSTVEWEKDAAFYIESMVGLKSVAWIDSEFRIRGLASREGDDAYVGHLANEGLWDSSDVNLWVSVYRGSELAGFIVGTIGIEEFVSPILADIGNDYAMRLTDGEEVVFSSANWDSRSTQFTTSRTITLVDTAAWNMSLAPTEDLVDSVAADSLRTLLFSLALSFMVTAAVFLAQASNRKSIALGRHQADLQVTNTELEQKRLELAQFSTRLEQQVVVRTAELEDTNRALTLEIAERKKAEEETRLLAAFPAEDPNPVLRVDEEGVILFANEASAPVLQTWGVGVADKLPAEWQTRSKDARDTGSGLRAELACGERVFEITVAPLKEWGEVNLYGLDVTERSLAERALEAEKDRIQGYLHVTGSMIVVLDADGRVRLVNRRACEILGYPEGEILGKPWFESFLPARMRKDVRPVFDRLMAGEIEPVEYFENQVVTSSGEERLMAWHNSVLRERGWIAGVISSGEDITERRMAERERERLLGQLDDKTKELEQIVFVSSHDLRSPLVNIQGFTKEAQEALDEIGELLQSQKLSPTVRERISEVLEHQIPEAFGYVLAGSTKIDSLLAGLLRLSRLGRAALRIETLDMNKLLGEVTNVFEFRIKETGTTVRVEKLPVCRGDSVQVNQVFSNLLDNALKFLDPQRQGEITITGTAEGEKSVYCVEDNGRGIAQQHHERVFEIFQSLGSGEGRGEGLGLSIVQRIVGRHGGRVRLESTPGHGSRFYVELPAGGK